MTDEELENIAREISGELKGLSGKSEDSLNKAEMRHKRVLEARQRALDKIKAAKQKSSVDREAKACMEYAVITEYGENHPLLLTLARIKLASWFRF